MTRKYEDQKRKNPARKKVDIGIGLDVLIIATAFCVAILTFMFFGRFGVSEQDPWLRDNADNQPTIEFQRPEAG